MKFELTARYSGAPRVGDTAFPALSLNEHLVFDSTRYIPPTATYNRRLAGELGKYALEIGNGFLLHGTPDQTTIRFLLPTT